MNDEIPWMCLRKVGVPNTGPGRFIIYPEAMTLWPHSVMLILSVGKYKRNVPLPLLFLANSQPKSRKPADIDQCVKNIIIHSKNVKIQ